MRTGELESKAGRDVHPGEVLVVRIGIMTRTLKILAIPPSRIGAKLLPDYMTDLTPASEYERAKQAAFEHMLARERGRGRPTKKDRRALSKIFEPEGALKILGVRGQASGIRCRSTKFQVPRSKYQDWPLSVGSWFLALAPCYLAVIPFLASWLLNETIRLF